MPSNHLLMALIALASIVNRTCMEGTLQATTYNTHLRT
ncbi:MAG: hypothetical protein QG671_4309 [Actinomycetota bacterium]|nr:hypothetical protein [Actinomycetota bacterium]